MMGTAGIGITADPAAPTPLSEKIHIARIVDDQPPPGYFEKGEDFTLSFQPKGRIFAVSRSSFGR
jgi:hypothetical protein